MDKQKLILPENCPHCEKPLLRLHWIARGVAEVAESFLVDVNARDNKADFPYQAYFQHDVPAQYENWDSLVIACAECDSVIEGVTSDFFSMGDPVPALTVAQRSQIIELLGYHLTERSLPASEHRQIEELQNQLIALNQVACGQLPELFMAATYTSVFPGGVRVTTPCRYDVTGRRVFNIEDSGVEIDDACEDEFVTLPNGTELREVDGISFEY